MSLAKRKHTSIMWAVGYSYGENGGSRPDIFEEGASGVFAYEVDARERVRRFPVSPNIRRVKVTIEPVERKKQKGRK